MAEKRRQIGEGWLERQGASLREKARDELETAATRRRIKARLLLCKDVWDEKETDIRKNSERPELLN
jgi:hypothetical protein